MLIEARKRPALERVYARYGRRLLRRAFARVWVGGAPWPVGDGPVIAYANHGAWWDPVLAVFLSHDVFRWDGYGLMDGAQLLRYPFFRHVGCFGVTSGGATAAGLAIDDARAVADYAAQLLRGGPSRALWLFPQGELLPGRAPLQFRSGLARISRAVPEACCVPVAVRYEFRADARPECCVRVGPSAPFGTLASASSAALTRRLERELSGTLATLDAELRTGDDLATLGYTTVLTAGATVSRIYDRTLGRLVHHFA